MSDDSQDEMFPADDLGFDSVVFRRKNVYFNAHVSVNVHIFNPIFRHYVKQLNFL